MNWSAIDARNADGEGWQIRVMLWDLGNREATCVTRVESCRGRRRFPTPIDAHHFVKRQAAKGSPLHQRALAYLVFKRLQS